MVALMVPSFANAEILFEDDFDDHPDWEVPYSATAQGCNIEAGCTDVPDGYYGYYISPSVITPLTGHGLHLDATNKRGATGKALTFWDQTDGTYQWTSGMQIGFDFPATNEVYVRYWTKMQPGFSFLKGGGTTSVMRKLNHISHYLYNGKPFTFFTSGGFMPTTVNQINRANNNNANVYNSLTIRPNPNYNGTQDVSKLNVIKGIADSTGVRNYFDVPSDGLPIGNYGGTGTDFNSLGMIGDGDWHALEFYLKNNSAPGVADGEYTFWMDGEIQIEAKGLIYREAASTLPDDIWNFVHLGGNAYNPFLGAGVSGEQWYAIDDVVISTEYIGPGYDISGVDVSAPAAPTGLRID